MKLLYEIIEEYAVRNPEKTAIFDDDGRISYSMLMDMSVSLAGVLAGLGIRTGDAVAVYVPYGREVLPAVIAVLKAGGVYVPFDEEYPVKRLEYMLADSGAGAMITTKTLWGSKKLDFPDDKVVFIDEYKCRESWSGEGVSLTSDSPALLLYTSGTTGNPKGVLHTHGMLVHLIDYIRVNEDAVPDENSVSGIMLSFSFIATQTFLIGPLISGGTVCIVSDEARKDMGYLYRFICEKRITHMFLPSSLAAILTEDYDTSGIFIFNGGEKLRNFRPHTGGSFLINSYGCTEAGGVLSKKVFGDEDRILVGRPCSNTQTLIVDENLKAVKTGETGELLISNDYMSKCYFKLPKLSESKWISLDEKIWFKTGDRAAYMENGDIELLGRTDNMVKLRGFRIETGEVETQIAAAILKYVSFNVGQLVVTVKSTGGSEHLCCYYEAEEELDEKMITEAIAGYLAPYMIPDVWVRMDSLPRNTNGKIMRNELPRPKRKYVTNGALDSEVLARLIYTASEILKTDCVIGPGDRFTGVGGTSLNAMQYTALLRDQGIKISISDVLSAADFRELAGKAEVAYEQLWPVEEYERIRSEFAARGEHIKKVLPISSRQDDMLFKQLIFPDKHDDLSVMMFQVESLISPEDLRSALDIVAEENEELRAAIVFRDVSVIQQVITDRRIPLNVADPESFDKAERDRIRDSMINEPFDPQFGSMMKVLCAYADTNGRKTSCLYILTNSIVIEESKLKEYIRRLMELLSHRYPEDISIRDWQFLLELSGDPAQKKKENRSGNVPLIIRRDSKDIRIYSENSGPRMVFVHTANTGSDAYYRLADRIRDDISFSVIEPYNLYHPSQACYGIGNIASNYIRILKEYIPHGPYILGGWCYGGVVAHEMACRLKSMGEEVEYLFMFDSHAISNEKLRRESRVMFAEIDREYFETCPLFEELRRNGMLEAMIDNSVHVTEDLQKFVPSFYNGKVTYFKPDQVPSGASGESLRYWKDMMEYEAGNYENFCSREKLKIIHTPHEHDLMMDDASLDIIVPEIYKDIVLA